MLTIERDQCTADVMVYTAQAFMSMCKSQTVAFILIKRFGLYGYYSRVVTIRGQRLFEEIQ